MLRGAASNVTIRANKRNDLGQHSSVSYGVRIGFHEHGIDAYWVHNIIIANVYHVVMKYETKFNAFYAVVYTPTCNPTLLMFISLFLLSTSFCPSCLRVEIVIPTAEPVNESASSVVGGPLPFGRPLHRSICDNQWGSPVKHLLPKTTPRVEGRSIEGTDKRSLTVRGERVAGHAFLSRRA